jgi:hypothetical protein
MVGKIINNTKPLDVQDPRPVFFGHYWFTGKPNLLGSDAMCLDYSIAKGGALVAYSWNGESELQARRDRLPTR